MALSVSLSLLLSLWLSPQAQAQAGAAPEVWFAPMQPTRRVDGTMAGSADYYGLFEPSAPWAYVAAHITVFKIYPELIRDATDAQLRQLILYLRNHHIALGLEAPVLMAQCQDLHAANSWVVGLVKRLKALGADLKTFSMVGPFVDGHGGSQLTACHRSITDVAADAARSVAALRELYPDLEVGEIEPIGQGSSFPDWRELGTWFAAWRAASGKPLAFLHLDTVWGTAWHDDMLQVYRTTRAAGIRLGVIYKGDGMDLSDASFTREALQNADEVESVLSGAPDDVILQSWEDYPRRALPDSDSTTMTGLVRAYLRAPTHFVQLTPHQMQLVRDDGVPIGGAEVAVELYDPAANLALQAQQIAGTVPHRAVDALLALRVHAECNCERNTARFSIAGYDFSQPQGDAAYQGDLATWVWAGRAPGSPRGPLALEVPGDRALVLNGPQFRVVPDRPFILKFSTSVDPQTANTGFLAVIFIGPGGTEIRRATQTLQTSWQEARLLRSTATGTLDVPSMHPGSRSIVRLRFAGDRNNRPSILALDTSAGAS